MPQFAQRLAQSVIAVPPLARHEDLSLNRAANRALIEYLEQGGIKTLLFGGNANLYHVRLSEYAELLAMLRDSAGPRTWIIPSVGPAFGTMMDQAPLVRESNVDTAMLLPHRDLATEEGIATAVRRFVDAAGIPIVLYLKYEGWLGVPVVRKLVDEGLVSWIKYAIVRDDPARDPYLSELVQQVEPSIVVSGIGEQPAITHLRDFGVATFTSGCVCVAPAMSRRLLAAVRANEYDDAESLRQQFQPLEDLRNRIHPIRVLHDAVKLAGICDTGPILPLLSHTTPEEQERIGHAAVALRQAEASTMV